jgi:uncharacterized protein YcbK (DUF882 family)
MTYRYFSPETDPKLFFCQETGEEGIDENFVTTLDQLRSVVGFPLNINSGFRSPRHSIEAAKDKPGQHAVGKAADIALLGSRKRIILVANALRLGFTGVGIHKNYIHLDMRTTTPVMWVY